MDDEDLSNLQDLCTESSTPIDLDVQDKEAKATQTVDFLKQKHIRSNADMGWEKDERWRGCGKEVCRWPMKDEEVVEKK